MLKQISGKLSRPLITSNNSSLPSSKNPIGIKRTKSLREPSGKKVGGQQGHVGVTRLQTLTPDARELCQLSSKLKIEFLIKGSNRKKIDL